jgi:predicted esterase
MRPVAVIALCAAAWIAVAPASADDGAAKEKKPADPAAPKEADEKDDIPTQDLRAGGDERMRYFVHGPKKDAKEPKTGWRVLYVLPGGDGGEGFKGFVKNIDRQALSDEYLVVQLVAAKWMENQPIVWPTSSVVLKEAKFTTEEFFAAVHKDVTKAYKVDPKRVFALGWSSGGPPVYTLTLREKSPVAGAYVAMSVFKPKELPKLEGGKDKPFFIDHSPDDKTCPFRMAEEARDALKKAGAAVEFVTYEGGHGWKGPLWERLRKGVAHLEKFSGK